MDNRKILDEVYRDFFGTVKEEKITPIDNSSNKYDNNPSFKVYKKFSNITTSSFKKRIEE